MKLPVRITLPCSGLTGYGSFSIGLLRHLPKASRLALEFHALFNTIQPSFPDEFRPLIDASTNVRGLGLVIGVPECIQQAGTEKKILYSMYETDNLPEKWRHFLHHAAEIWTPSEHSREVFARYHPRVKVVHIGYDDLAYQRRRGPRQKFWTDIGFPQLKDAFVIGTAGVMSNRKGVDISVAAFQHSFADKDDAFLVIKGRDSKMEAETPHERIIWIEQDWSQEQMAGFYRALDLFIQPSRGEGFCLPPLEAAACGTPALVTRYSGPCEYIDDTDIIGIETFGLEPATQMQVKGSSWARPNPYDLTTKMLAVYNARRRVRPNLSYWGHGAMAKRFENELLAASRRLQ